MQSPQEFLIEDIGSQGDGIARLDGKTIFISGALPGERVVGHLQNDRAVLFDILTPSPERAPLSCPHFPVCGGCRLQHLAMRPYSKLKRERLDKVLEKAGLARDALQPILCAKPYTRRRARLATLRRKNRLKIGFNEWRSHGIVDLEDCAILDKRITKLIPVLRTILLDWLPRNNDTGDIQISALPDGLDLVLIGGAEPNLSLRTTLAALAEEQNLAQISWRAASREPIEPIAHRVPLYVTYGTTRVAFPPASFLQATAETEQALLHFAQGALADRERVLDLFCGLGGFGLSLEQAKELTFADLDGPAIAALDEALRKNRKPGQKTKSVRRDLLRDPFTAEECRAFDAVLFDPPRGGAAAQAQELAKTNLKRIVAISCDPPSFVRDARILINGGYQMISLLPVDQFLWSTHIELAACFTR